MSWSRPLNLIKIWSFITCTSPFLIYIIHVYIFIICQKRGRGELKIYITVWFNDEIFVWNKQLKLVYFILSKKVKSNKKILLDFKFHFVCYQRSLTLQQCLILPHCTFLYFIRFCINHNKQNVYWYYMYVSHDAIIFMYIY